MELNLFKTRNDYEEMVMNVEVVLDAFPVVVQKYISTVNFIQCDLQPKYLDLVDEKNKLESELKEKEKEVDELKRKHSAARKMLDDEKRRGKDFREEAIQLKEQLSRVKSVLHDELGGLNERTMEKLSFIHEPMLTDRLDTILEGDTTGSVITDLSYTRDEDDLLNDSPERRGNKRQLKEKENQDPIIKRRKSTTFKSLEVKNGERLVATTTVTVEPNGPCTATSVIENLPSPKGINVECRRRLDQYESGSEINQPCGSGDWGVFSIKKPSSTSSLPTQFSPFSMNAINTRAHVFVQKSMLKGENCNACLKRLRFSATALKCKNCKAHAHPFCKDQVPLPCVPVGNTPSKNNKEKKSIADYTPLTSPMVPAIVIHCIKEIEARGLEEVGLYRIPGSDKGVRSLKEKFSRGKGVPNLSDVADIHVVCGTLKDFLRSLKEPLIPLSSRGEVIQAAMKGDVDERRCRLCDIISELPQPNRDTLSYVLLHLQKVAETPDCMMGPENLSVVFGQTIVGEKGLSSHEPFDPFTEAKRANQGMLELLKLPAEFYESFLSNPEPPLQKTPSSNSLKYFITTPTLNTPNTVKHLKNIRYFETP